MRAATAVVRAVTGAAAAFASGFAFFSSGRLARGLRNESALPDAAHGAALCAFGASTAFRKGAAPSFELFGQDAAWTHSRAHD